MSTFGRITDLWKLLINEVKNLDDHYYHKFRDLVDPDADEEMRVCSSNQFRHKTTLHCAQRQANFADNWTIQHL